MGIGKRQKIWARKTSKGFNSGKVDAGCQDQAVALLDACFCVKVAASSVVNQQQVLSAALAEPVDELHTYVQQQSACNVDETSWRQAEQTKQSWL